MTIVNEKVLAVQFALKRRGVTQTQIADELGITKQAVYSYIYGRSSSTRFENHLRDKYGIDIDALVPEQEVADV